MSSLGGADEVITYPEAGRLLERKPLEAMLLLRIFGLSDGGASVAMGTVQALAEKIGAGHTSPPLALDADIGTGDESPLVAAIKQDPNDRRRVIRLLLWRLEHHGYLFPAVVRLSSMRRGFSSSESGWMKEIADLLEKVGWMVGSQQRKNRSDPVYGLAAGSRDAVMAFVTTGETDLTAIKDWVS